MPSVLYPSIKWKQDIITFNNTTKSGVDTAALSMNEYKIVNVPISYKAPRSCETKVDWIQLYLMTVPEWFLNFSKYIYL